MGFKQFRNDDGTEKVQPLYVRFRDSQSGDIIADPTAAYDLTEEEFSWKTPAAPLDTKAIMEISYN